VRAGPRPHGADNLTPADRFRKLRHLTNHWARPGGPRAYYWYLTFENAVQLHDLAARCQQAISLPHYDLTPRQGMHLTLDRVAYEKDTTPDDLRALTAAAVKACADIPAFDLTIGGLGGTSGAIGFEAGPHEPTTHLRDTLRAAALAAHPRATPRGTGFHAHVAIAYCNTDGVPADQTVAALGQLGTLPRVTVTITEASLVLLERGPRAYLWHTVARIPLATAMAADRPDR